jgi:hypothetical protein
MRAAATYDIFTQICLHENIKRMHTGRGDVIHMSPASPLKLPSQSRCAEHIAVYYFQTGYLQDIAAGSV